jgi:hypothetical protein
VNILFFFPAIFNSVSCFVISFELEFTAQRSTAVNGPLNFVEI